jgi:hypothetical protein
VTQRVKREREIFLFQFLLPQNDDDSAKLSGGVIIILFIVLFFFFEKDAALREQHHSESRVQRWSKRRAFCRWCREKRSVGVGSMRFP